MEFDPEELRILITALASSRLDPMDTKEFREKSWELEKKISRVYRETEMYKSWAASWENAGENESQENARNSRADSGSEE